MKLNQNFVLREIAGEAMLVPTGEISAKINGFIALNEVGAVIVKKLAEACEISDIVKALTDEFDVDEETALRDAESFLKGLRENEVVTD